MLSFRSACYFCFAKVILFAPLTVILYSPCNSQRAERNIIDAKHHIICNLLQHHLRQSLNLVHLCRK